MMFIVKNIFVFLASIIALCLIVVILKNIGMNDILNISISSFVFGIFITLYFKEIKICIPVFFLFYTSLFFLSMSVEVILMLLISLLIFFIIKMMMPKLKKVNIQNIEIIKKVNN